MYVHKNHSLLSQYLYPIFVFLLYFLICFNSINLETFFSSIFFSFSHSLSVWQAVDATGRTALHIICEEHSSSFSESQIIQVRELYNTLARINILSDEEEEDMNYRL
tara:strand:+ start:1583 stop:1903 length:321 start_codon:yes stop_codon:yes gene_type:complete